MKISASTAPVWINSNPSFKHFDGRIVRYLSKQAPIAYWEYSQELDEASSLDIAVTLLHNYKDGQTISKMMMSYGQVQKDIIFFITFFPNKLADRYLNFGKELTNA